MQLPSNFSSTVDFFSQLPQQKIAKVISVLLLAYIAYVLAQITWFIAPIGQYHVSSSVTVKVAKQNTETATISLTGLKTLNLFGAYTDIIEEVETAEVESAPETQAIENRYGEAASNGDSSGEADPYASAGDSGGSSGGDDSYPA